MPFRDDILRGIRLFAIVFAGVLICVAAYRILRSPNEGAPATNNGESVPLPVAPTAAPSSNAAPIAQDSSGPPSEQHGLVVPPPPPMEGSPAPTRTIRSRASGVPPPPPLAMRASRAAASSKPALSGREFESPEIGAFPAGPIEESPDSSPAAAKGGVGYKSLIEANASHPVVDPLAEAPAEESADTPAKGNRFFKAVGKIFRPGGKKETPPFTLHPRN